MALYIVASIMKNEGFVYGPCWPGDAGLRHGTTRIILPFSQIASYFTQIASFPVAFVVICLVLFYFGIILLGKVDSCENNSRYHSLF